VNARFVTVFLKDSFGGTLPLILHDKIMPFWDKTAQHPNTLRQEFPKVANA